MPKIDLTKVTRYDVDNDGCHYPHSSGDFVLFADIEALAAGEGVTPEEVDALEHLEHDFRHQMPDPEKTYQLSEIEKAKRHEKTPITKISDYQQVRGLSAEVCQKLNDQRPETIGQASRIPGITPAAISLLMVHLKKSAG